VSIRNRTHRHTLGLTRAGSVVVLTLVVLVVLSVFAPARGVFIALAAVLLALIVGGLAGGPSARSQAGSDPGADAAAQYERERGWR
jgi:hypothetical protein